MEYLNAFWVGGLICVIGQLLIDLTKLTPARIMVLFVTSGVALGALGLYAPLVEFAGCGATVGKMAGQAVPSVMADKAGLGTASLTLPDGSHIGALVAVNAAGDVYHPETGEWMAGGHLPDGTPVPAVKMLVQTGKASDFNGNTTIGVIATDAALTREQTNRLALLAHDGYGRAIRPVHMPVDGDTVFALSTGRRQGEYMLLCALAAEVMARAIANAVEAAKA